LKIHSAFLFSNGRAFRSGSSPYSPTQITDKRPAGSFCWVELATTDQNAELLPERLLFFRGWLFRTALAESRSRGKRNQQWQKKSLGHRVSLHRRSQTGQTGFGKDVRIERAASRFSFSLSLSDRLRQFFHRARVRLPFHAPAPLENPLRAGPVSQSSV